jgi:RND family efflux transporter MFP subunit
MSRHLAIIATVSLGLALPASAEDYTVERSTIPIMKPVYGQVESRDVVPARARIGGTLVEIHVEEGDAVKAGDKIANVVDEKLALQLDAIEARQEAIQAQLENARVNVDRARQLFEKGTIAKTRLDEQQTQFDVLTNQLTAIEADKSVIVQQAKEGTVNAPASGRVLSVPVTQGSVVLPGETIARIAGGGYFLRLSLPERHAAGIKEGDTVEVATRGLTRQDSTTSSPENMTVGHVAKVYPEITDGRVTVDVEVDKLGDFFVGERTLVSIPVGSREALIVPATALVTRHGIDYVRVREDGGVSDVTVIPGEKHKRDGEDYVEVLTGLHPGDEVVLP